MTVPTYTAKIDWNNSGTFGFTGSDVSTRIRGGGILVHRGRDQARSYSPPVAAKMDATLDNQSGDYSTENSGSPLAGYLYPGHLTQLLATYGSNTYDTAGLQYDAGGLPYDGKSYGLFTGYLDDITQSPDKNKQSAGIPAIGALGRLVGKIISTPLYQNITTDVALGYILDAVGFSSTRRRISTGATTLQWWWLDNEDAFQAAAALLNSEGPGAALYESGDGNIVFEGTNFRAGARRSTVSQQTIYAQGLEPALSPPFSYAPRQQDIVNVVTLTQKVRSAKTLGVVWSLGASLTFAVGETKIIVARNSNSDPITAAVTPVAATDYTVSAGAISTVSLNRASGGNIQITMTAGGAGATVTGLQLRGQLVSVDNTTNVTNTVDTSTSQTRYGIRAVSPSARSEIALTTVQSLANLIVNAYSTPSPLVSVRIISANETRLLACLKRQISDRMTVVVGDSLNWAYDQAGKQYDQGGIAYDANSYAFNADVFIESIQHEITNNQQVHVTTFGCSKASATSSGIWGSGQWGTMLWGF